MLNGVGAAIMKPKQIGMFIGKNELNLYPQGSKSWVSGCIAVETTVYATLISLIYSFVIYIRLSLNFSKFAYSFNF